ncbi:aldo/keto reductase [Roseomonas sp. CECT 9278]|uniref:aldo/keto reductase n=1 Tax=Roseomonas sp. CECT 9278 TaxID=2845823 RepID=UPI001E4B371A|nr:aldo/keto reductase [Roseomonas sp. CECT 9278]CAH0259831.1 Pyridoxal 4-dehydrogenase [Roseomonas sp. CECT 9278]
MDPTAKRRIGRTALEATALGFGGAPLGGFRATIPEAEAQAILDAAWEGGVRLFDTSPFYGHGRSELRFGHALRQRPRDQYILSTKIGRVMHAARPGEAPPAGMRPNGLPGFLPRFDYTYDGVMRSLEQSHLRLGLDRIDVVLIHDIDLWSVGDPDVLEDRFRTAMDGGYRALHELREQGVIGAIGCGLNDAGMCLRFARAGDFDCMLLAGRYTLLEQGAMAAFLPYCAERGMSVILGGPFNSGILAAEVKDSATYDYATAPPAVVAKARRIEAVCRRHDTPLPAAALQFVLAHPVVCSVIPGALARSEIEANIAHLRRPIPAALWHDLKAEGLLDPAAPVPGG